MGTLLEQQTASIAAMNAKLRAERAGEGKNAARGHMSPLGGLARPGHGQRAQTMRDHLENNIRDLRREEPRRK
jgi:hypothetical protein